jgi:predicted transcriptional regulator
LSGTIVVISVPDAFAGGCMSCIRETVELTKDAEKNLREVAHIGRTAIATAQRLAEELEEITNVNDSSMSESSQTLPQKSTKKALLKPLKIGKK